MIQVVISVSCGWQSSSETANKPSTQPVLALEANELFFLWRNRILFVNSLMSPHPYLIVRTPLALQDSCLPTSHASIPAGPLMCTPWGPSSEGAKVFNEPHSIKRCLLHLTSYPYMFAQRRSTQHTCQAGQQETFLTQELNRAELSS